MIIQTGMRTDIPAFYSRWFLNRLRVGVVCVRNPFNASQVTRYELDPSVVDAIGFCTKNPTPMLAHLDALAEYGQYWFVTITAYGPDIESRVPPCERVVESFRALSRELGPQCVGWRYDPIIVDEVHTPAWHEREFERLCVALEGYTRTCVISFLERYKKVARNYPEARETPRDVWLSLGRRLVKIASSHGIVVKPCGACREELEGTGADCGGCMTRETYEEALGCRLDFPSGHAARSECACFLTADIGAYNSCGHLCRYCYANNDPEAVRRNMERHDPESPFLIGGYEPGDVVHDAVQKSWKQPQLTLF